MYILTWVAEEWNVLGIICFSVIILHLFLVLFIYIYQPIVLHPHWASKEQGEDLLLSISLTLKLTILHTLGHFIPHNQLHPLIPIIIYTLSFNLIHHLLHHPLLSLIIIPHPRLRSALVLVLTRLLQRRCTLMLILTVSPNSYIYLSYKFILLVLIDKIAYNKKDTAQHKQCHNYNTGPPKKVVRIVICWF
jgi:hypothetical protein